MVAFDAVGPSSSGAGNTGSTTLSWNHTCGAAATVLYVGVAVGGPDTGLSASVTYNSVAMTQVGSIVHSAGGTTGFLAVFRLANPATGSALSVAVTVSGGTPGSLSGGSQSYSGVVSTGSPATNTRVGVGSLSATVNGTTAGNLVVAFLACGTNGSTSTAPANSRFANAVNNSSAAGNSNGEDQAAGGNVTIGFSAADDSAIIAFEAQGAAGGWALPVARQIKSRLQRSRKQPQTAFWVAATPSTAVQVSAPVQPPRIPVPVRSRARVGPRGLCAAGVAVTAVVATAPQQRPPVPRPVPQRAHVGPQGRLGGGIASQVFATRGTPARPQPFVFRSPPRARARLGMAGAAADGIASAIITPLGTPGPSWRAGPRSLAPRRSVWHGNAGPQAVAPAAPQAYQHPPPQARRPAPVRAVVRRNAGTTNAAPVITALTRPQPVRVKPPRRVLWHGNAGPQPAAVVTTPPRVRPLPPRRNPARAVWRVVRGLVNLPPPSFNVARSTPTVTAGAASDSTATDPRDGTATVTAAVSSTPAVSDPRDGTATVTAPDTSSPTVT